MAGLWTIYRRELAGLFFGPLAWVLLCLALLVNGYWFTAFLQLTGGDVSESMSLALGGSIPYWGFMVVVPPLLTMRMISEEARSGMLEFLLTAPVSRRGGRARQAAGGDHVHGADVVGRACLRRDHRRARHGARGGTDWGPVIGGLFGSGLASALFCALGLVASAGTATPLVAAFLALVLNVGVLSLPLLGDLSGVGPQHWLRQVLVHLDVVTQFQGSFVIGALDSAHVVFFLAWTAFFVFLATRLLEARRWS